MRINEKAARLKRFSELLDKEQTGNPTQFAKKVGISRTCLFEVMEEVRYLGVKVAYFPKKGSYCYTGSKKLVVEIPVKVIDEKDLREIYGGNCPDAFAVSVGHTVAHGGNLVFSHAPFFKTLKTA